MLAVALENRMLLDGHLHEQIARRPPFGARFPLAGQTNAIAGVHARRHFYRQLLGFLYPPLPAAGGAGVGDGAAAAAAGRAGLLHLKEALLHAHLSGAATGATGGGAAAAARAGARAGAARHQGRHADLHRSAAHRVFQGHIKGVAKVRATLSAAASATATAKDIAKNIAEDIGKATAFEAAAGLTLDPRVPELIVSRALLGTGQHVVSLGGFFELFVRPRIVGIAIRVILHRDPTIGFLDGFVVSAFADAENLVVVAFCHGNRRLHRLISL